MGDTAIYARYSYRVGEKVYTGSRVRIWDMPFSNPGITPETLSPPTAGAMVTVFYDPARPTESVLDPSYPIAPMSFLLLGSLIGAAGAVFTKPLSRILAAWATFPER
jgi:hypothetical protein